MTAPQPDDNFVTDGVGVDGLVLVARLSAAVTGRPQRFHWHPAEDRCNPQCRELDQ